MDLPDEILLEIFYLVEGYHPELYIVNTRLVCRRFSRLSSPLLITTRYFSLCISPSHRLRA